MLRQNFRLLVATGCDDNEKVSYNRKGMVINYVSLVSKYNLIVLWFVKVTHSLNYH
jgi:hypothetical protein